MQSNRLGNVALGLSVLGLVAMFACSNASLGWLLPWAVLICPIGLVLGVFALRHPPRRMAAWAVAFGLWGSAYIPTIWLFYLRAFRG